MGNGESWQVKADPAHCDEKVLLLWVAPHCALSRASANLRREVCSYLHSPQPLVQVRPNEVRYFDLRAKRWRRLFALEAPLTDYEMDYALTFVDQFYIFVCGGSKSPASAHMLAPGRMITLPEMLIGRLSHAVAYLPTQKRVCVFGGAKSQACEAYSQQAWKPLPHMSALRSGINAVTIKTSVYLCGGDSQGSVEVFDGQKDSFTSLGLRLPFSLGCIAVGLGDVVLCIAAEVSVWWNVRERRILSQRSHVMYRTSSVCPPRVVGDRVFVTATLECRLYSVVSGELLEAWR